MLSRGGLGFIAAQWLQQWLLFVDDGPRLRQIG